MVNRNAHAENPRSRTRRLITNVRVSPAEGNGSDHEAEVRASFHVIRFRDDAMHHYVGRYTGTGSASPISGGRSRAA